jgi:hypothetical protein
MARHYTSEQRDVLRRGYLYDQLSLRDAATRAGMFYSTALRLRAKAKEEGDDWEFLRAAYRLSTDGVTMISRQMAEDFLRERQRIMNLLDAGYGDRAAENQLGPLARTEILVKLTDAYRKIVADIARMDPEGMRFGVVISVMQFLGRFIAQQYPDKSAEWLAIFSAARPKLEEEFKRR